MALHHISPKHLAQKNLKELDYIGYIFIALGLFFSIPQLLLIFQNKSASDVSLISWFGWFFIGLWWFFYGIEKDVKPLIVGAGIGLIMKGITIYGIIKYEGFTSLTLNPFF